MPARVADFIRANKDAILHSWEKRVVSEGHEVALVGATLRDDIPAVLDELAKWLASDAVPGTSHFGARMLGHAMQRLDEGLPLSQLLDEYRLFRETIIRFVLEAEEHEQERSGAREEDRDTRVEGLARLNAGLDVVLAQSIQQFVEERDRRAAEERAHAERFRALASASSEVQYRMSPDWSEMRELHSQGFLANTDRPNANWLDEYIHPDDQPQVMAAIREAIRTKSVFQFEHRVRRADGSLGWTLSRAVPVTDNNGEIVEWFGSASDITERKQAEDELRTERDFTSAVVDTAGSLVIVFDRERRITRFNHACERATGYSAAEVLGRTFDFLIPPEQLPQVQDVWDDLLKGRFPNTYENHWVSKDGTRRLIAWANTAIVGPGGAVEHVIGTGMDITERKRAELGLQESEERLKRAQEIAHLGSWELDIPTNRLLWSDEVYRILGLEPQSFEATYETFLEAVHPEDRAAVHEAYSGSVREGKSGYEITHRIVRKSTGEVRVVREKCEHVRDASGQIVRSVGMVHDITERERAEAARERLVQALREEDRRKNEFLAVLSHELRNPLTPVRNSLYILERAAPGGDQARRAQTVIGRQVDQLARLVDDLLEITRLTRSKIQLQRDRLELNELVQRTIEDHRSTIEKAGLTLETALADEPVFVSGDWNRLAQVVGNLLQNSAKFTPSGGHVIVSLSVERVARRAVLRVADTGVGITPDLLEGLFQPFSQAKQSLDRSKGGLGLGLALVKGLVELHGGEVRAHSAGVGHGSEFTVFLPLDVQEANAGKAVPAAPVQVRPHRRVLIIEDNIDAADSLREALELDGHEVAVAYNGPEGIAKAREFRPDVVLCDIGLPGMDGYTVARVLRSDEGLKDARLVALSGYALPEDLQRAAEAGFDRHVAKPPSLEKLAVVLGNGSARSGDHRQG